ncbi:MAG: hypothetical protein GY708_23570, partial [Actinomycetia bacterium]|nr:hypothetical protein [Actinomycetes bacterium]
MRQLLRIGVYMSVKRWSKMTKTAWALFGALALLVAACGGESEVVDSRAPNAKEAGMQLSAAGDLAAAATEHGSCEETPGAIIDRTRSGDGLRARAAELTWHVVLPSPEIAAHFDRDDWFTLRGVQFTVAAIPVSDAGVESTLAGAQSRTLTVEMSGFGGRQWPTDLPVLVGSETVEDGVYAPAYAAALYSDGIAFVGWCSAPATHDWNREVRRLQLDSHFDMLDMLIADPDNPML